LAAVAQIVKVGAERLFVAALNDACLDSEHT